MITPVEPCGGGMLSTTFVQLEVARLWRRFKVIEKSTTQISDVDIETEIHVEVKNVGGTNAKFNLYACVDW
jgi:hypothetical protein